MGRLRTLSAEETLRILIQNGFIQVRQRGSHIVVQKRLRDTTLTVVVPNHRELRMGTLSSIIRQSRLPRELFEA